LEARLAALGSRDRPAQKSATGVHPQSPAPGFGLGSRASKMKKERPGKSSSAKMIRYSPQSAPVLGARSKRLASATGTNRGPVAWNGLNEPSVLSTRGHSMP
jgi:hypothetical protein